MIIHIYSIMRNEEYLLPYFLRHYSTFADSIFIFNDHSSDKTVGIAQKNNKVKMMDFKYNRGLNEDDFNECFTCAYKKFSRGIANWVMCVDADEFVYSKNIKDVLKTQKEKGIRAIKTTSYTMVSEKLPKGRSQIYDECFMGVRTPGFDKEITFDPSLDITFSGGRHTITISGGIRPVKAKITLLHYRYLSMDYLLKRNTESFARTPAMTTEIKNYRMKKAIDWYKNSFKFLVKAV